MRYRTLVLTLSLITSNADAGCTAAINAAAARHGVPVPILAAISNTESGHRQYAINADGVPYFPSTRAAAESAIRTHLRTARYVDIGCGQINWQAHGHHFARPEQLLNPTTNLNYAARYLRQHYNRYGSWTKAVGRYHSGTEELAQRYTCSVLDTYHRQLGTVRTSNDNAYCNKAITVNSQNVSPFHRHLTTQ